MAMTEEEAQRLVQALNDLSAATGKTTGLTVEQQEALSKANARLSAFSNAAGAALDAFVTYNKETYKGASAAKASAASMDKMGEAAVAAAAGLALLMPGGVVVKALIAGLGLLTAKLVGLGKEVALQTDEIQKAFQQLAKIGGTGAEGLQGVFDGLMKVGLGTEKFAEYLKLIGDNSGDLIEFSGTLNKGRKTFENTMDALSHEQRVQMQQLGLDRTAQSEAVMAYIRQQKMLSAGDKARMDLSSVSIMRFIKETDELTRITGANREEQQKILDAALKEDIFASFIDDLERQGGEAAKQAENIQQMNIMLTKRFGPEVAKGFRDALPDILGNSEESIKFFRSFGDEGQAMLDRLRKGAVSQNEINAMFAKTARAGERNYRDYAFQYQTNTAKDILFSAKEMRKSIGITAQDIEKMGEEAAKELADILANPELKTAAETAENQARTQIAQQKLINLGMSDYIHAQNIVTTNNMRLAEAALAAAIALGKLSPEEAQQTAAMTNTGGTIVGGSIVGGAGGEGDAAAIMNAAEQGSYLRKVVGAESGGRNIPNASGAGGKPTSSAFGLAQMTKGTFETLVKQAGTNNPLYGKTFEDMKRDTGLQMEAARQLTDKNRAMLQSYGLPTTDAALYLAHFLGGAGASRVLSMPDGVSLISAGVSSQQIAANPMLQKMGTVGELKKWADAKMGGTGFEVAKYAEGGQLGSGKMGIAGEAGPELISGPASITPMNDLMNAFNKMHSLQEQSLYILENISRASVNTADASNKMLQYAQN
jgi:hypothetical protein